MKAGRLDHCKARDIGKLSFRDDQGDGRPIGSTTAACSSALSRLENLSVCGAIPVPQRLLAPQQH